MPPRFVVLCFRSQTATNPVDVQGRLISSAIYSKANPVVSPRYDGGLLCSPRSGQASVLRAAALEACIMAPRL